MTKIPVSNETHQFIEGGVAPLFLLPCLRLVMTHPIVTKIIELAQPIAQSLNLEVVDVVFQTNQSPSKLRVDIRSMLEDTSLENCEQMSRALEAELDAENLLPDAYVLEISSPGLSRQLTSERDFVTFRGFPISVQTREPFKGQLEWVGRLIEKKEGLLRINLKGRTVSIPADNIIQVQLQDQD